MVNKLARLMDLAQERYEELDSTNQRAAPNELFLSGEGFKRSLLEFALVEYGRTEVVFRANRK